MHFGGIGVGNGNGTFIVRSYRYINYNKYKNNCLKLKNEVGMEVLKSKQTRVVYRDN